MKPFSKPPNSAPPANDDDMPLRPESAAPLWRILAASGYGLWAWLGLALTLGMYPLGRGSTLIPLAVGAVMVGAGLLVACLPWRGAPDWHGWKPHRDIRPTPAAMLALVTFLPMLAVGGLARGDNDFWATRLASAALMLCSVASLAYTGYRFRNQLSSSLQHATSALPVNRLVFAGYAGGLWLWLCLLSQDEPISSTSLYPWILLLLVLALLLGLLEGLDWQSLSNHSGPLRDGALRPARFIAALFTYVFPCIALLLARHEGVDLIVAALAVPSCLFGKWMERRLYESLLARSAAN